MPDFADFAVKAELLIFWMCIVEDVEEPDKEIAVG